VGVGKIFFQGANSRFSMGGKVVKFHFTHSKLRKQPFYQKFNRKTSDFKIREGLDPLPLPSDAHGFQCSYAYDL